MIYSFLVNLFAFYNICNVILQKNNNYEIYIFYILSYDFFFNSLW